MSYNSEALGRKRICFSKTCNVILIPCRQEYFEASIELWYQSDVFLDAKQEASQEIKGAMEKQNMGFQEAVEFLYQPPPNENDFVSCDLLDLYDDHNITAKREHMAENALVQVPPPVESQVRVHAPSTSPSQKVQKSENEYENQFTGKKRETEASDMDVNDSMLSDVTTQGSSNDSDLNLSLYSYKSSNSNVPSGDNNEDSYLTNTDSETSSAIPSPLANPNPEDRAYTHHISMDNYGADRHHVYHSSDGNAMKRPSLSIEIEDHHDEPIVTVNNSENGLVTVENLKNKRRVSSNINDDFKPNPISRSSSSSSNDGTSVEERSSSSSISHMTPLAQNGENSSSSSSDEAEKGGNDSTGRERIEVRVPKASPTAQSDSTSSTTSAYCEIEVLLVTTNIKRARDTALSIQQRYPSYQWKIEVATSTDQVLSRLKERQDSYLDFLKQLDEKLVAKLENFVVPPGSDNGMRGRDDKFCAPFPAVSPKTSTSISALPPPISTYNCNGNGTGNSSYKRSPLTPPAVIAKSPTLSKDKDGELRNHHDNRKQLFDCQDVDDPQYVARSPNYEYNEVIHDKESILWSERGLLSPRVAVRHRDSIDGNRHRRAGLRSSLTQAMLWAVNNAAEQQQLLSVTPEATLKKYTSNSSVDNRDDHTSHNNTPTCVNRNGTSKDSDGGSGSMYGGDIVKPVGQLHRESLMTDSPPNRCVDKAPKSASPTEPFRRKLINSISWSSLHLPQPQYHLVSIDESFGRLDRAAEGHSDEEDGEHPSAETTSLLDRILVMYGNNIGFSVAINNFEEEEFKLVDVKDTGSSTKNWISKEGIPYMPELSNKLQSLSNVYDQESYITDTQSEDDDTITDLMQYQKDKEVWRDSHWSEDGWAFRNVDPEQQPPGGAEYLK